MELMKLIKRSDYSSMPWKNGLGTTEEIAIFPKAARFPDDAFDWRLSSATVSGTNQFSTFPGYDRILVVWQGSGLHLNGEPLLPYAPLQFLGEEQIDCTLINDIVTDLGVIFNRKKMCASMRIKILTVDDRPTRLKLDSGENFLFCTEGAFTAQDHLVKVNDTLYAEGAPDVAVRPLETTMCIHVNITPKT
jgi:uncharacterized protein